MLPFSAESARARTAQHSWQQLAVRQRLRPVRETRRLLVDRADELSTAVADDVQRNAAEVVGTDLLSSAVAAKFLERYSAGILAPSRPRGRPIWLLDCSDTIHRRPRGLVGVIGTWNYPIFLTLGAVLPALTAGNAVLWKPSEHTPRTAAALHRLLLDAGYDPGLIALLPGERAAGPQLCEADIDFLHFTGSDAIGRRIAARLGERLIPSALELSGCDALVVLPDGDHALAARTAAYGTTLNNGQTCMAVRRAFVQRSRLDEFVRELLPLLAAMPRQPLVTAGQREQVSRFVEAARAAGIRVEPATTDAERPTLLVNPPADSPACTEASFAPLISVLDYEDDAELSRKIAASPFGLSAAVFSGDRRRAEAFAANLRAGSVVVNDVIVPTAHPGTPFGGRGSSGWGVTQGAEGLLQMTVPQVVSRRYGRFRPHVDAALANDPSITDLMRGLLRFTHSRSLWDRLGGLRQLLRSLRNRKKPGV